LRTRPKTGAAVDLAFIILTRVTLPSTAAELEGNRSPVVMPVADAAAKEWRSGPVIAAPGGGAAASARNRRT
jgi:hypothetical protein